MQNRTFVTAFSGNFDDRFAKFEQKIYGAVKIIVAHKLQKILLQHSFRLYWRKCPRNFAYMCCCQFGLFVLFVHFGAG
jgi:hypothetical protein